MLVLTGVEVDEGVMVEVGVGVGVYPGGTRVRVLVTAGEVAVSAAKATGTIVAAKRTKAFVKCILNKLVLVEQELVCLIWSDMGVVVVVDIQDPPSRVKNEWS